MSGEAHYTEPFKGKDGKWYWDLKAANGEIVSQSEGYETKEGARKGIDAATDAAVAVRELAESDAEDEGVADQVREEG